MTDSDRLVQAARAAQLKAYCPYSRFPVGAAVMAEDGTIFAGCNVENASYGLAMCAERNAVNTMVAAGYRRIKLAAVAARAAKPCGACRQVLLEFSTPKTKLILAGPRSRRAVKVFNLLPEPFHPKDL